MFIDHDGIEVRVMTQCHDMKKRSIDKEEVSEIDPSWIPITVHKDTLRTEIRNRQENNQTRCAINTLVLIGLARARAGANVAVARN